MLPFKDFEYNIKEVFYAHQGWIYLYTLIKYLYKLINIGWINLYTFLFNTKCNLFVWLQSWIFSSYYSSVTQHFSNYSNMQICCSRNISYY